jgi:hypothetical protein
LALLVNMQTAMAQSPTPDQIKRTLLSEIRYYRDIDLAEARHSCAHHFMPHEVRGLAAKGTPHPGTIPTCKTVLTEGLTRGAGIDLYINLGVTELTGRTGLMDDLDFTKIIKNEEHIQIYKSVRDAAKADKTSYVTVSGRELPLPTALAVDAGAYAGYRQPQAAIAPSRTDADIERTIAQCYEENSTHSRSACYLAGARFGQSVRRTVDAASADPALSKAPNAPLQGKESGRRAQ